MRRIAMPTGRVALDHQCATKAASGTLRFVDADLPPAGRPGARVTGRNRSCQHDVGSSATPAAVREAAGVAEALLRSACVDLAMRS